MNSIRTELQKLDQLYRNVVRTFTGDLIMIYDYLLKQIDSFHICVLHSAARQASGCEVFRLPFINQNIAFCSSVGNYFIIQYMINSYIPDLIHFYFL